MSSGETGAAVRSGRSSAGETGAGVATGDGSKLSAPQVAMSKEQPLVSPSTQSDAMDATRVRDRQGATRERGWVRLCETTRAMQVLTTRKSYFGMVLLLCACWA